MTAAAALGSRRARRVSRASVPPLARTSASPARGAEDREGVGDLQLPRAEAEERSRTAARRAGGAPAAGGLEHVPPQEDALQVRRRDVVAERGGVDLAELRDREGLRCEREARVRVGQLRVQPLARGERDLAVVERRRRQGDRPDATPCPRGGSDRRRSARAPGSSSRAATRRGRAPGRCACRAARGARARGCPPSRRAAAGSTAPASLPVRAGRPEAPRLRRRGRAPASRAGPAARPRALAAPRRRQRGPEAAC